MAVFIPGVGLVDTTSTLNIPLAGIVFLEEDVVLPPGEGAGSRLNRRLPGNFLRRFGLGASSAVVFPESGLLLNDGTNLLLNDNSYLLLTGNK